MCGHTLFTAVIGKLTCGFFISFRICFFSLKAYIQFHKHSNAHSITSRDLKKKKKSARRNASISMNKNITVIMSSRYLGCESDCLGNLAQVEKMAQCGEI